MSSAHLKPSETGDFGAIVTFLGVGTVVVGEWDLYVATMGDFCSETASVVEILKLQLLVLALLM